MNTSEAPAWLRRQNRFQMLFHTPNVVGSARQVRLWTAKKYSDSRNLRSPCPGWPRRDCAAATTGKVLAQSSSVIRVSIASAVYC